MNNNKDAVNESNNENYEVDNTIPAAIMSLIRVAPRVLSSQRALAYASEVGEGFRPIIPSLAVKSAYGLSWLYVFADTAVKTNDDFTKRKDTTHATKVAGYTFTFHCIASMAAPAFTVHSIVKYSRKAIEAANIMKHSPVAKLWAPTLLAISSIPLIIHPIDHVSEFVLERTLYPVLFKDEPLHPHHHNHDQSHSTSQQITNNNNNNSSSSNNNNNNNSNNNKEKH